MSNNLLSNNWLVINILFNSFLRYIFDFGLISILWDIFSNVFHLLVISVSLLNGLVGHLIYGLIFSYGFCDWNHLSYGLRDIFSILSLVRNLLLNSHWFVIGIGLLNWNIFNIG